MKMSLGSSKDIALRSTSRSGPSAFSSAELSDSRRWSGLLKGRCSLLREGDGVKNLSQLVALLRRVTLADGDVSLEESRWLRKLVSELPAETDVNEEFDEEKFKSIVTSEGDAEELLRAMLVLSLSDGQTSSEEWKIVQEVAALFSFPADRLEKLRSETILTAEPYG
jgi:uncharacterized tellurite resistance protein B-like protein